MPDTVNLRLLALYHVVDVRWLGLKESRARNHLDTRWSQLLIALTETELGFRLFDRHEGIRISRYTPTATGDGWLTAARAVAGAAHDLEAIAGPLSSGQPANNKLVRLADVLDAYQGHVQHQRVQAWLRVTLWAWSHGAHYPTPEYMALRPYMEVLCNTIRELSRLTGLYRSRATVPASPLPDRSSPTAPPTS